MKKLIAVLSFCLLFSGSLFAAKAWEFEFKGIGGYSHISSSANGNTNSVSDFLAGGGIDITRCWNNYIGIDFSASIMQPLSTKSVYYGQTFTNEVLPEFGLSFSAGLAVMIPITDSLKVKTVQGFGYNSYGRGIPENYFVFSLDNDYDDFLSVGYTGSIGATYMPVKNFGINGGVDYTLVFVITDRELDSGFSYKEKAFAWYLRPYIGGVIRLGKNL